MSWFHPKDIGFAVRQKLASLGYGARLFARLFVDPDLRREDSDIRALAAEIRLLRERIEQMEKERRE